MLNQLADWLDDRTGYRPFLRTFSDEQIPGGARWRYVFGSTLASVFLIQAFTGVLMMTAYSPSSSSAWGSVYYINNVMWMGWFIRGLHHFGASAVMVLLVMHLLQVLLAGAYRKPREVNWWLGLALLVLTVTFGHTGYQLPWDQKGFWATKVMTNIMGGAPGGRALPQNARGRRHGVRQSNDRPPLRPARGHLAHPDGPLPLGPCFAGETPRPDSSRAAGAVARRDLLAGPDLQKPGFSGPRRRRSWWP